MDKEEEGIDKQAQSSDLEAAVPTENNPQLDAIHELEEDIIRNDTIPETSKDTPGSNGVFPVGAFDTSKE